MENKADNRDVLYRGFVQNYNYMRSTFSGMFDLEPGSVGIKVGTGIIVKFKRRDYSKGWFYDKYCDE